MQTFGGKLNKGLTGKYLRQAGRMRKQPVPAGGRGVEKLTGEIIKGILTWAAFRHAGLLLYLDRNLGERKRNVNKECRLFPQALRESINSRSVVEVELRKI